MRRIAHDTSFDTRGSRPDPCLDPSRGAIEAHPCHGQDRPAGLHRQSWQSGARRPAHLQRRAFDKHDEKVGTGAGVCTIVSVPPPPPKIEDTFLTCLLTATFDKRGQIIFGGTVPFPQPGIVGHFGIVGGTDDFRKAHGEAVLTVISDKLQDAVFELE